MAPPGSQFVSPKEINCIHSDIKAKTTPKVKKIHRWNMTNGIETKTGQMMQRQILSMTKDQCFDAYRKPIRRNIFLATMDQIMPWHPW